MKTYYFFLSGVLFYFQMQYSYAQPSSQPAFSGKDLEDHMLVKAMDDLYYTPEEIEGTPYLNEVFVPGEIYGYKVVFAGIPMRYNISTDLIELKRNDRLYVLDPEPAIRKIVIGDDTFVVAKSDVIGKMNNGYFLLLDSGYIQLMAKKVITLRGAQPPKALESSGTPAKYHELPDSFYYKIGNGELTKVTSLRKMIESFPDKQEEIKQYAKKEKISKRKEELILLVKLYNSL